MCSSKDASEQTHTRTWLWTLRLGLALVSTGIALLCGEGYLRLVLFSDLFNDSSLRNPGLYAPWTSNDYWKLEARLGNSKKKLATVYAHPLLGWTGEFDPTTFKHSDTPRSDTRIPVLLFGDSFAACVAPARCFQELLNQDEQFRDKYYLLNYGVQGYGLDQSYLLMREALKLYDKPVVLFSLMPLDIDRLTLELRPMLKPFFTVEHDRLVLQYPYSESLLSYLELNPVSIRSYLYRWLVFTDILDRERALHRHEQEQMARRTQITELILQEVKTLLTEKKVPYRVVILNSKLSLTSKDTWRVNALQAALTRFDIPYLSARAILKRHYGEELPISELIDPTSNHPTTKYNKLVLDGISHQFLRDTVGQLDNNSAPLR